MTESGSLPFPLIVTGAVAAIVVALLMVRRIRWALPVIILMLFVASTGTQGDEYSGLRLWLFALQTNRSPVFLALGMLLLVAAAAHWGRLSFALPIQGAFLLAIGLYAGLLRIVHESPASGLTSITFAALTIGPILLIVPALIEDWEDILRMLRAIMGGHMIWLGAVLVQVLVNPSLLSLGKNARFLGLTGNPQHAAAYLAVMATIALWLFLCDSHRRARVLWIGMFAVNLLLLVSTGSRTGAGMFVIGVTVATYGRLGRAALYLPVLVLALYGGYYAATVLLGVDLAQAQRLTSTEDTRTGAWLTMLESAMKSPLIGVGVGQAGDSENSYLYAFASYGLGMITLILLMIAATGVVCLKLFARRRALAPEQRSMIDLVTAYSAMYFAGGFFEGYIIARAAAPLVLMLMFSGIASRMLAFTREGAHQEWEEASGDGIDDEVDEGYEGDGPAPAWS